MTSSDYNMLRLEAPRDMLQITDGTVSQENAVELANPATWVRTLVRQQKQAEDDMKELMDLCGQTVDRTDQRIQRIEQAYQTLAEGTRYVYDRVNANQEIEESWVRGELAAAASAYQTFTRHVWQAIIEKTNEATEKQVCQSMQLARVQDALSFLGEAHNARNEHIAAFQGNVESWARDHQDRVSALEHDHQERVSTLEQDLRNAKAEISRLASRVPLPASPARPPATKPATPSAWRSPAPPSSTSNHEATQSPAGPSTTEMRATLRQLRRISTSPPPLPPALQSLGRPFQPATRRTRPPAVPTSPRPPANYPPAAPPTFRALHTAAGGAGGGRPPRGPPRTPRNRSPSPIDRPLPQAPRPPPPQALTPEMVRAIAEGVARAQQPQAPREDRIHTSRLKLKNPENFDGKNGSFNQWWESVSMFLGFYPETVDRQKIAWIGTLLTDTALSWHLHRYRELRDNDTWANYSAAIRTEYRNEREAAEAQAKLGQLRYQGSIRAYMTEFRALNNFARATGEALREKVDMAMTHAILQMRFAHYLEDFADDEGFLQATSQAGLQVEKLKALTQAREQGNSSGSGSKKEEKREKRPEKGNEKEKERGKDVQSTNRPRDTRNSQNDYGRTGNWPSETAAFEGVPISEKREHQGTRGCHRCGRTGHRAFQCYAATTLKGTGLPPAPWKVSGVTEGRKRQRLEREEDEEVHTAKQQKVAAVETMEIDDPELPIWAESDESDF